MAGERQEKRTSPGEKIAKGSLHGVNQIMEDGGERMLHSVPKVTRMVAKRVPGIGVDLVLGAGEVLAAKREDKARKAFGAVGGFLGSLGGGGLGLLTGPAAPVAAPVGAAIGGAFGEDIGTDIYDEHKAQIDGAVHRAGEAWDDSWEAGQRRLEDTARWVTVRNAKLFGR